MKIKECIKKLFFSRERNATNKAVLDFLANIDFEKIENHPPKSINRICFILPPLFKFSGGHTSVFRLGTRFVNYGCEVDYIVFGTSRPDNLNAIADTILKDRKGTIKFWDELSDYVSDVVIATNIESVFYAKKLDGYKFLFVQDFEPFFYEKGDKSLYADKIYDLGFHLISLGSWNKKQIEKYTETKSRIDVIEFPYEPQEYKFTERDYDSYKSKNEFKLCVYIRETPRRLPCFCQHIAGRLSEIFQKYGKTLQVVYFGEDKSVQYFNGENVGKLSKKELNSIYNQCDFGMVASMTNISLVPYEMMATGLPIIEFKQGSFCDFFDENDAFLYDYDCGKLGNEIIESINNPEILKKRDAKIKSKLINLSWDKTAEQFFGVIKNVSRN